MPTGTIDSTVPQTSNTVNNTPTYITGFKTAVLNIFGIGDNTATTQAMTIASTGKVVFTVSPVTITGLATSAGAQSLVVTPGAHTAVIAEVQDVDIEAHTMTITGAITTQRFTFLGQPTITAAAALTVTTAATFDIAGPPMPTGAGPCTITNAYGGRIEAGTLTASAATTVDTAASLVVEGAPIRGTNVTITNTYGGLFKESGAKTLASTAVRVANTATSSTASIDKVALSVTSTGTWDGTSANNVGIDIGAITNGTNNYSLRCAQQIKSTLATGTSPFAVDSTTVVTNLNADQCDGFNASATPAANTIAVGDGSGKLAAGWGGAASTLATLNGSSKVVEEPASKAQASGIASLDGSSLVVQNPANATATPTASKIPIADASGKLAASWGGNASTLATLNSSTKVVEDPANATATPTASKIPIADGSGKLAAGWGGNASTLATLDGSSLVVQNPANATATATASKIPIADGSGKLDTWVTAFTQSAIGTGTATGNIVVINAGFRPKIVFHWNVNAADATTIGAQLTITTDDTDTLTTGSQEHPSGAAGHAAIGYSGTVASVGAFSATGFSIAANTSGRNYQWAAIS